MASDLAAKSSDELSQILADKENEIQTASRSLLIVEDEILKLDRKILELRAQKKDFEIHAQKGRHNLRILHSEKREVTNYFWRSKGK